jgi:hypothetical protein
VMRSGSHGTRPTTLPPFQDPATAGLGLATTDSDPWSPGHVRSARHRAASTWATEVEDLLEVRCAGCGEMLPIPPVPALTAAPSAARLPCGSMLAAPPGSGVAAACLWRRARRLCPSVPLMSVYRALVEVRKNIQIHVVLCLTLPPTQLYLYL